jgi:hypothetical protein
MDEAVQDRSDKFSKVIDREPEGGRIPRRLGKSQPLELNGVFCLSERPISASTQLAGIAALRGWGNIRP